MSKPYKFSNKSDMRKFKKDLEKEITNQARDAFLKDSYEVNCPHCGKSIKARAGKNKCPYCKNIVDLTIDIDF